MCKVVIICVIYVDLWYDAFWTFFLQSLVTFVNKHLNKVNLEVSDLDRQVSDTVIRLSNPEFTY